MSSASQIGGASGPSREGFSTTVLPAAIAIGKNHSGTIAGKLNGLMMPTTPSGWRERVDVDAGRDVLGVRALDVGAGHARRRTRRPPVPRAISPRGVGEHLAVLGGEDRGELAACGALSSSRNANITAWRFAIDVSRQSGERPGRGLHGGVDVGGRGEPHLLLHDAERGVVDGRRCGRTSPATDAPSIQWSRIVVAAASPLAWVSVMCSGS